MNRVVQLVIGLVVVVVLAQLGCVVINVGSNGDGDGDADAGTPGDGGLALDAGPDSDGGPEGDAGPGDGARGRIDGRCNTLVVRVGEVATCNITLANDGNRDLVVEQVDFTTAADLGVVLPNLPPYFVAPGTSVSIPVQVGPEVAGELSATVSLSTNSVEPVGPVTINVIAVDVVDVSIQLSWDDAQADVDLRLIRADDQGRFCASGAEREIVAAQGVVAEDCGPDAIADNDCGFENCRNEPFPDWDADGATSDGDPRLNIDDVAGNGPEDIQVASLGTGRYLVGVHQFDGVDATFNAKVLVGGHLAGDFTGFVSATLPWAEPAVIAVGDATLCIDEPSGCP